MTTRRSRYAEPHARRRTVLRTSSRVARRLTGACPRRAATATRRWARPGASLGAPALALLTTACCYLWSLGASGYANYFYSAAVQAGSESWKAFFFGSSDAANSITVDKPPAALWPMALSVRLFGLSSWAILVPAGADGRRDGRRAVRGRTPPVRPGRRAARRRGRSR